jgi:hypothetical protein
VRGYSNGVIKVRFSTLSTIANWILVIIFSLNVALVPESGNFACFVAELICLLWSKMILCS